MPATSILFVARPAGGGMKNHLLDLVSRLDPREFHPLLAAPPGGDLIRAAKALGVAVYPVSLPDGLSAAMSVRCIGELAGLIRRQCPDVIHLHGVTAGAIGRLAALSSILPGGKRSAVVYTFHGVPQAATRSLAQLGLSWAERRLAGRTDRIIAVSRAMAAYLSGSLGLPAEKVRVIYNGIDLSRFPAASRNALPAGENGPPGGWSKPAIRLQLGVREGGLVVGTVARLAAEKGLDCLVRAAALIDPAYPGTCFWVAGEGPLRRHLEHLAAGAGLGSRFRFLGYRADVRALLAETDIFVLPSRSEGFSISLLEAMASCLPVVGSRTGGIPEVVRHGQEGLLVPPGDPAALARGITCLLRDGSLRGRLGRQGRVRVERCFRLEATVARTETLYREVLRAREGTA